MKVHFLRLMSLVALCLLLAAPAALLAQDDELSGFDLQVNNVLAGEEFSVGEFTSVIQSSWRSDHPRYQIQISLAANTVETCNYGYSNSNRLLRKVILARVTITDLLTSETIATRTFEGDTPARCPFTMTFTVGETSVTRYGNINANGFGAWLRTSLRDLPGVPDELTERADRSLTIGEHTDEVEQVAFSHDNTLIASGSRDETVRIWNIEDANQLHVIYVGSSVQAIAFSPDDRQIIIADISHVYAHSVQTGERLFEFDIDAGVIEDVAYSPDGSRVAIAESGDGKVFIMSSDGQRRLQTLRTTSRRVVSVAFSPDSSKLVTSNIIFIGVGRDDEGVIEVWNTETGRRLLEIDAHNGDPRNATFSASGDRIVSASWDSTARVFDAETGDELLVINHSTFVNDARFNPDDTLIATAAIRPYAISIWDATTGQSVKTIGTHHRDSIREIAFSSDGTLLASASQDSTVQIYDLKTQGLVED